MAKKDPIAIPIIFVPGIMGSRLANSDNELVWDPDNLLMTFGDSFDSPYKRKLRLIGKSFDKNFLNVAGKLDSEIQDDEEHWQGKMNTNEKLIPQDTKPNPNNLRDFSQSEQPHVKRGWGTVYWDSYGEFLNHLDTFTKYICMHTGNCHVYMPVYAHGYNWTQSNADSGKELSKTIDEAIAEMGELQIPCKKVMIITHSMGGLVARACSKLDGMESKIYSICHVAMPDNGSPATYKRMKAGFEGVGIAAKFLGNNGQDVTAVLGHAPGGLELLPNDYYRQEDGSSDPWLNVSDVSSIKYLYKSSAKEVYIEPNKWWRLINPEWLEPGKDLIDESEFDKFVTIILSVSEFHAKLGEYKHPNTWMIWGTGRQAWDRICWELHNLTVDSVEYYNLSYRENGKNMISFGIYSDDKHSIKHRDSISFPSFQRMEHVDGRMYEVCGSAKMAAPDAKGDGTVHAGVGTHAGDSGIMKKIPVNTHSEHQSIMKDSAVLKHTDEFIKTVLRDFARCAFSV